MNNIKKGKKYPFDEALIVNEIIDEMEEKK